MFVVSFSLLPLIGSFLASSWLVELSLISSSSLGLPSAGILRRLWVWAWFSWPKTIKSSERHCAIISQAEKVGLVVDLK